MDVWRGVVEPGWRYVGHADDEPCPARHLAYVVSGKLGVRMVDGSEAEGAPGSVMVIEPGHDAWTVGEESCVFLDFAESVAPAGS